MTNYVSEYAKQEKIRPIFFCYKKHLENMQ